MEDFLTLFLFVTLFFSKLSCGELGILGPQFEHCSNHLETPLHYDRKIILLTRSSAVLRALTPEQSLCVMRSI